MGTIFLGAYDSVGCPQGLPVAIGNNPTSYEGWVCFLGSWLACVCTHNGTDGKDSLLKAKWQSPPAECQMIAWMQCRMLYLNAVPATGLAGGPGRTLDPQECFNKALEMVAALRPPLETTATKRYTPAELQRLRAACSLSVPEMETSLPGFHEQLLTEGRTKKDTEAMLAPSGRHRQSGVGVRVSGTG
jgi:hypothetical protein